MDYRINLWLWLATRRILLAATTGYLLGTFPTADIVAKRASNGLVKLRETGSGNPGRGQCSQGSGEASRLLDYVG